MPTDTTNPLWMDDSIQFPRLISEIYANCTIDGNDWNHLMDSMSLEEHELEELFSRARDKWERIKKELL